MAFWISATISASDALSVRGLSGQVACSVSDELPNDVTVKAAIDSKDLVAEKIVSLRQKIVDFTAKAQAN
jgi:hypothetical protein